MIRELEERIWEDFLQDVIEREGGYVDHVNDVGGPTKYGITIDTLQAYRESYGHTEEVTKADIIKLTISEAKKIYYDLYIDPFTFIDDYYTAVIVVDAAINHGIKHTVKLLQKAVNAINTDTLKVDGVLGELTKQATNRVDQSKLRNHFIAQRLRFYGNILRANQSQRVFAAGWMNRVADVLEKSV